jgi:hypothetical protein
MVGPTKFFTGVLIAVLSIFMAFNSGGNFTVFLLCIAVLAMILAFTSWD